MRKKVSNNGRKNKKYESIGPDKLPLIHFSGQVVSHPKCTPPVSEATVEVAGIRKKTDKRGYFRISIPVKNRKIRRFVLNITKEGYGLLSKVYTSSVINHTWVMTKGTTQEFDPTQDVVLTDVRRAAIQSFCTGTLSSQVDWSQYKHRRKPRQVDKEGNYIGDASDSVKRAVAFAEQAIICNNGITIRISGNSLVDSRGNPPSGKLTATISTVDVFDPDSMPGDFTAELNGKIGYMVTFGAGMISITSKGEHYQLKKGAKAILEIPINEAQLKTKPKLDPEIPLLIYDQKEGIWREIGAANLDKDKMAYVGEIYHLSAFNMDLVKTDQACIRLKTPDLGAAFDIEVSLEYSGNNIVRTFNVENVTQKLHVIYNLPSNTDIAIRAFSGGMIPTPICDTVSVNTGQAQQPSTPNCPDYPYTACQGETVLVRYPLVPTLDGYPNPDGTIFLQWYYVYSGLSSTNDGYIVQESTIGPAVSWTTIHTTNDDRTEHSTFTTGVKTIGEYWYRVQAKRQPNNATSDVLYVRIASITAVTNPTTLRIRNDLTNQNISGIEWGFYNGIISARVGTSITDVLNNTGSARELLYPYEATSDVANIELIRPGYYRDFDVSDIGGNYFVYIICGWWDTVLNPYTFEFMYYQKTYTAIINCFGQWGSANKYNTIAIISPYFDPEDLLVSRWLPHTHWPGHPECP